MTAHARLSASSAHRWLKCPASVAPGGAASIYAATGTFAHDIAAKCLDKNLDPGDFLLKQGKVEGFQITCDQEMVDAVQFYVDTVGKDSQGGDLHWFEMPLLDALSTVDKDFGGTADAVRYRAVDKSLRVFDFKFGSGTYVETERNEQLQLYALGAMLFVGKPIEKVTVTIVQPRFEGAAPERSWTFNAIDLLDFAADLKDAAAKTREPNPVPVAGEHCKWCPKERTCPALQAKQDALVKAEFGPVVDYGQLSIALASIPLVKSRIKAIEEFAYAEATAGRFGEAHGYKLVDKVARRQWKSDGDVIEWAQANAIDPYLPRELMSPAQMEAVVAKDAPKGKKREAGKVLEPFVVKVSSGTALVPVSDNRPAVKGITASDFPALAG